MVWMVGKINSLPENFDIKKSFLKKRMEVFTSETPLEIQPKYSHWVNCEAVSSS